MPRDTSWRVEHASGTLTSAPAEVRSTKGRGFRVYAQNTGATNSMDISFDGGQNWYPIAKGTTLAVDVAYHAFWLKSDVGTTYAALLFVG